jgi:hypothetical protein
MLPALLPAAAVNAAKQHKMKPAAWLSIVHSAPGVLEMGPAPDISVGWQHQPPSERSAAHSPSAAISL